MSDQNGIWAQYTEYVYACPYHFLATVFGSEGEERAIPVKRHAPLALLQAVSKPPRRGGQAHFAPRTTHDHRRDGARPVPGGFEAGSTHSRPGRRALHVLLGHNRGRC